MRRAHEFLDLVGALDARAHLRRRSTHRRRTGAPARSRRRRSPAFRPPARISSQRARELGRARASRRSARCRSPGLRTARAPAAHRPRAGPARSTGSTLERARQVERARSSMSVCSDVGPEHRAGSRRSARCVGCRVTATQATRAARRAGQLARRAAASPGAPRARTRSRSHPPRSQRGVHARRRGHAADLDEAGALMRGLRTVLRARHRRARLREHGAAPAAPDRPPTSARCRPAPGRSRRRPCARHLRRWPRRSRRRAARPSAADDASASSRPGTTFSVARSRQFTPTSSSARCSRRASTSACASSMSGCIEGFEQHEHAAARARASMQRSSSAPRQHAHDGEHAARAGERAPSSTW